MRSPSSTPHSFLPVTASSAYTQPPWSPATTTPTSPAGPRRGGPPPAPWPPPPPPAAGAGGGPGKTAGGKIDPPRLRERRRHDLVARRPRTARVTGVRQVVPVERPVRRS